MTQTTNDDYTPPENLYSDDFTEVRDTIASYAWSKGGTAYFGDEATTAGLPDATVYLGRDPENGELYVEVEKRDLSGENTWLELRNDLSASEDEKEETVNKATAD